MSGLNLDYVFMLSSKGLNSRHNFPDEFTGTIADRYPIIGINRKSSFALTPKIVKTFVCDAIHVRILRSCAGELVKIFRSGLALSQTVKSMGRFREILTVLARNGFDGLITQSDLAQGLPDFVLPKSTRSLRQEPLDRNWPATIGRQLRKSFEELGPGFVKLGQILATREDMFPAEFIVEMRHLQDNVRGIPFQEAMTLLSQSLGYDYLQVFASVDPEPIGQASIGVVYRAHLKDGPSVVIKIRRPEIIKNIKVDFNILNFIVQKLENLDPDIRYLNLSRLVEEQARSLENELDFNIERFNIEKMRTFLAKHDSSNLIYLPHIYRDYSSASVLVMEELQGIPFTQSTLIRDHLRENQGLVTKSITSLLKVLLNEGFFHADLHPGNLFLLPSGQVGVIDFGLCGHLTKSTRQSLMVILYGLVEGHFQQLVFELIEISEYEGVPDLRILTHDLQAALSPYLGLPYIEISPAKMIRHVLKIIVQHRIYLPPELTLVLRSLAAIDGLSQSLQIDLDFFKVIRTNLLTFMKQFLSWKELARESVWLGRDLSATIRILPQGLRWFLREWGRKQYAIEIVHRGLDQEIHKLQRAIIFLGSCLIGAGLTIAGVILAVGAPGKLAQGWMVGVGILFGIAFVIFLWGCSLLKR